MHDNTSFGAGSGLTLWNDTSDPNYAHAIGHKANNNTIVTKRANDATFTITSSAQGALSADYSYYARPVNDTDSMAWFPRGTLAQWQPWLGQDAHSRKSPKAISTPNELRFEYHASPTPKTVALGANYIDIKNATYNGSITLAPYTSAVLLRN